MPFAQSERARACDVLAAVDPSAPTLCAGWDAATLAAHLWVRENSLLPAAGVVVPALAGRTAARMDEVRRSLSYPELIAALRLGPGNPLFRLPGVDEAVNTLEFFVHGEDVRRAGSGLPPHPDDTALADEFWRRLRPLARLRLHRAPASVVLERTDRPSPHPAYRVGRGPRILTLAGAPGELVLYLFGRRAAADVDVFADDEILAAFERFPLGA